MIGIGGVALTVLVIVVLAGVTTPLSTAVEDGATGTIGLVLASDGGAPSDSPGSADASPGPSRETMRQAGLPGGRAIAAAVRAAVWAVGAIWRAGRRLLRGLGREARRARRLQREREHREALRRMDRQLESNLARWRGAREARERLRGLVREWADQDAAIARMRAMIRQGWRRNRASASHQRRMEEDWLLRDDARADSRFEVLRELARRARQ
jgi:hypothetical protein